MLLPNSNGFERVVSDRSVDIAKMNKYPSYRT